MDFKFKTDDFKFTADDSEFKAEIPGFGKVKVEDDKVKFKVGGLDVKLKVDEHHHHSETHHVSVPGIDVSVNVGIPVAVQVEYGNLLQLRICGTKRIDEEANQRTEYEIEVITNLQHFGLKQKYTVSRRYKQFKNFYGALTAQFPNVSIPPFPPGDFFGRFKSEVVGQRRAVFEQIFRVIESSDAIKMSSVVREFLSEGTYNIGGF